MGSPLGRREGENLPPAGPHPQCHRSQGPPAAEGPRPPRRAGRPGPLESDPQAPRVCYPAPSRNSAARPEGARAALRRREGARVPAVRGQGASGRRGTGPGRRRRATKEGEKEGRWSAGGPLRAGRLFEPPHRRRRCARRPGPFCFPPTHTGSQAFTPRPPPAPPRRDGGPRITNGPRVRVRELFFNCVGRRRIDR